MNVLQFLLASQKIDKSLDCQIARDSEQVTLFFHENCSGVTSEPDKC